MNHEHYIFEWLKCGSEFGNYRSNESFVILDSILHSFELLLTKFQNFLNTDFTLEIFAMTRKYFRNTGFTNIGIGMSILAK